jgi:hypothetical protein
MSSSRQRALTCNNERERYIFRFEGDYPGTCDEDMEGRRRSRKLGEARLDKFHTIFGRIAECSAKSNVQHPGESLEKSWKRRHI